VACFIDSTHLVGFCEVEMQD